MCDYDYWSKQTNQFIGKLVNVASEYPFVKLDKKAPVIHRGLPKGWEKIYEQVMSELSPEERIDAYSIIAMAYLEDGGTVCIPLEILKRIYRKLEQDQ